MVAETEYHLIVDGLFMYSCDTLADALIDLLCFYFIFNIEYPKTMYSLFIFLQHFVLGLKDSSRVPNSVLTLFSNLS
jgi:hypothetical protein